MTRRVLIMGAAGRDFHVFNCCYRHNNDAEVVAFTATQIPHIDDRRYPPELAGPMYPDGIPITGDEKLMDLVRDNRVDLVAFSYSDIRHIDVMHHASRVAAAGADFVIIGATYTMLDSMRPVVSPAMIWLRVRCCGNVGGRLLCRFPRP